MKKTTFLTALIFAYVVCSAQTNYYWSLGKKIWLDTDSAIMIVKFDSEQNLRGFTSSISAASTMPTQTPAALVRQKSKSDNETFRKLNSDKSIVAKTFANKYHYSKAPFYLTGDILLHPKAGVSVEDILKKFGIEGQIFKDILMGGDVVVRLNNFV